MRASTSYLLALSLAVLAAGCAGDDLASPSPESVAASLQPAIQLEGEPAAVYALDDRMAHYNVPGVSVAVLEGGEMAWARGWGIGHLETGAPVTPTTLFQAASISKPVAALAAMSLVEDGALALDGPVNAHLTTWQVPDNEFTTDSVVTLRGLLSHTAGLTVWGFPGYRKDRPFADGQAVATNVQVLDGLGNTAPVRVYRMPGIGWQYSGGGYTVMEEMVENVTGRPFHEVMQERVLGPAGMAHSTFQQPLPEARWNEASRGHRADGTEVEGEWHTYPEQAAAGLWTTPSDLLSLSQHLLGIRAGAVTDGVVSAATLETMLTPHREGEEGFNSYGLGFGITGEGDARTFGHGGSNEGFRAAWIVYPATGQGAVIMTNGDRGSALAAEIMRALAVAYQWPAGQPEVRASRSLDADEAAQYAGRYRLEGSELAVEVRAGEGVLLVDVPQQGTFTLHAVPDTADAFFDATDGTRIEFQRDESGAVVELLQNGQVRLVREG